MRQTGRFFLNAAEQGGLEAAPSLESDRLPHRLGPRGRPPMDNWPAVLPGAADTRAKTDVPFLLKRRARAGEPGSRDVP